MVLGDRSPGRVGRRRIFSKLAEAPRCDVPLGMGARRFVASRVRRPGSGVQGQASRVRRPGSGIRDVRSRPRTLGACLRVTPVTDAAGGEAAVTEGGGRPTGHGVTPARAARAAAGAARSASRAGEKAASDHTARRASPSANGVPTSSLVREGPRRCASRVSARRRRPVDHAGSRHGRRNDDRDGASARRATSSRRSRASVAGAPSTTCDS
jgi:hypothetical protein